MKILCPPTLSISCGNIFCLLICTTVNHTCKFQFIFLSSPFFFFPVSLTSNSLALVPGTGTLMSWIFPEGGSDPLPTAYNKSYHHIELIKIIRLPWLTVISNIRATLKIPTFSYLAYVNLHLIGIHKIFSENFQI